MSFDSKHFQKKTDAFNKKVNLSEVDQLADVFKPIYYSFGTISNLSFS